ncbi:L-aspartate oxidase [Cereibacter johrii]|uniref:L-aspartate oxidase n=1 Tax=Cereibacter johrii TaxID=445629 RepID=UPI000DCDD08E|nr:FAD-binding protein [Cereibacter johrii]RAZ87125.1 succinate dehydrogenase [Cereibacter johrii]
MEISEAARRRADVVVVGSGLAGLLAALTARESGAAVTLVAQGEIGKSANSWLASGGLAAVTGVDPEDSPELHLADIRRTARGLVFDDIARTFVAEAGPAIRRLEALGVAFHRTDGDLALFPAPGHSRARSIRCEGGGAVGLMTTLLDRAGEAGIALLGQTTAIEVLKDAGGAAAGLLCHGPDGWLEIEAGAVLLACGGMGRIFPVTSNHALADGSGYYLALKAGAVLTDLEFVQFTPTSLAWPPEVRGTSTGGGLMAQPGVKLLNARGERFMHRYDPERMEASTRDVLSRAIFREVSEGRGTPHHAVWVDMSETDRAAVAQVSGRFLRAIAAVGIDPFTERVEVAPDVHFAMGGVAADVDGRTAVPGLFAAGEITAGLHGATRLNSNGLTEAAVFGIRAGRAAAGHAARSGHRPPAAPAAARLVQSLIAPDPRKLNGQPRADLIGIRATGGGTGTTDPAPLKAEIRALLVEGAGIERTGAAVERALARHAALEPRIEAALAASGPVEGFSLDAMYVLSRLILEASGTRTESRGAHFRTDCPEQDSGWDRHIAFVAGPVPAPGGPRP